MVVEAVMEEERITQAKATLEKGRIKRDNK
jgi:hypothetical protein